MLLSVTVMVVSLAAVTSKVRMCVSPDAMPIEKIEDGEHIGLASDFIKQITNNSGSVIELVPTHSWDQSLEYARSGRCDILSAAEENSELKQYFHFTRSYMHFPILIIARAGMPFVSSLDSIRNSRIGIPEGAEYIETLYKRFPDLQIVEVGSTLEGLKALLSQTIDHYLDISASVAYTSRLYGMTHTKIVGVTGDDFHYRIAVSKGDPKLYEKLQSGIESINESEKKRIFSRWIDVDMKLVTDYKLLGVCRISIDRSSITAKML